MATELHDPVQPIDDDKAIESSLAQVRDSLARLKELNTQYRAGEIHVYVPDGLQDNSLPLEQLVEQLLPASHAALQAASRSLFFSLPVAFDPAASVGPYLGLVDRDPVGTPYRVLDMGALIATSAFGENDPAVVQAIVESLPFVISRFAHSEYQTLLSLRLKAALNRVAPAGTPRHFIVNTGAEAVENAMKSVLLNRVKTTEDADGGLIVSFDGSFPGRTPRCLAFTPPSRRGWFPHFDWLHISYPFEEPTSPKGTARHEERSLKQLWDLSSPDACPTPKAKTHSGARWRRRRFLARPGRDVNVFVETQRPSLTADVVDVKRVAAVLVEPVQGERRASHQRAVYAKLRVLTKIYDVPLIFDEVQTGWGMTGRMGPRAVRSSLPARRRHMGEEGPERCALRERELATFLRKKEVQHDREGDSVGMVRLLALDKLDLDQVNKTGALAGRLEHAKTIARFWRMRGAGVMLAFDVLRADWRDALRDRTFRRGLVLPLRRAHAARYPRYDTMPSAMDEGCRFSGRGSRISWRRSPLHNVRTRRYASDSDIRSDDRGHRLAADGSTRGSHVVRGTGVRRGCAISAERARVGGRPLLQYPVETLEATMASSSAIGLRWRSGIRRVIAAWAACSDHDEGVSRIRTR